MPSSHRVRKACRTLSEAKDGRIEQVSNTIANRCRGIKPSTRASLRGRPPRPGCGTGRAGGARPCSSCEERVSQSSSGEKTRDASTHLRSRSTRRRNDERGTTATAYPRPRAREKLPVVMRPMTSLSPGGAHSYPHGQGQRTSALDLHSQHPHPRPSRTPSSPDWRPPTFNSLSPASPRPSSTPFPSPLVLPCRTASS